MAKKRKISSRFPDAPGAASRNKKAKTNASTSAGAQKQKQKAASRGGMPKGAAQPQGQAKAASKQHHRNQEPVIPFSADQNILLIGEGDLSYAASLAFHHGCRNLTATVLEKSEAELLAKYPHAKQNIDMILHPERFRKGARHGDSAEQDPDQEDNAESQAGSDDEASEKGDDAPSDDNIEDDDDEDDDEDNDDAAKDAIPNHPSPNQNRILYSTDAATLKPFLTKPPRHNHPVKLPPPRTGLFHRIIFNFPHVGGKSTDVNRQVRHNQSLLVAFFERALPSLRPGPDASIIVTTFEGEPYTLWNVRDLARHAGLAVETSFRFPWSSYPGYRHARTLGVVRAGAEESRTAWKGEDRNARSYIFKRKDDVGVPVKKKEKKKTEPELSDSDSGSE